MKIIFPIFFIFFISKSIAQVVTKTEEFDDGGLKSITYFKKIENKFVVVKEEQKKVRLFCPECQEKAQALVENKDEI